MKDAKKRALELADIIAFREDLFSKAIREAKRELTDHLRKLDSETVKEVMERIRGYS